MTMPVFNEPQETIKLNFYKALEEVMNGKKITRIEWENADIYGFMKANVLHIHTETGDHTWTVSDGDMKATDWVSY